jgi:hypothetical protein
MMMMMMITSKMSLNPLKKEKRKREIERGVG